MGALEAGASRCESQRFRDALVLLVCSLLLPGFREAEAALNPDPSLTPLWNRSCRVLRKDTLSEKSEKSPSSPRRSIVSIGRYIQNVASAAPARRKAPACHPHLQSNTPILLFQPDLENCPRTCQSEDLQSEESIT